MKKNKLKSKSIKRKGSITIIAIYIFLLIISSSTMILLFASSQAALAKYQLEKIQYRYSSEDDLNKMVYNESFIDQYIKEAIFDIFRSGFKAGDGKYDIKIEKDHQLRKTIHKAIFRLEDIDERKNIIFEIVSKYNNVSGSIIASGPCINQIFELNKAILIEEKLDLEDKVLFAEFIDKVEKENSDYDCILNLNSKKVNLEENTIIKLQHSSPKEEKLYSDKIIIREENGLEDNIENFTKESIVINIKSQERDKDLTIGEIGLKETIKINGALYIEGDLIINQDFEFSGIIIINDGELIVNSLNKPRINGMIFYRGSNIDIEKLDIIYDQKAIYKQGSFLPGFIDIEIDTIKKY